jgi:hypothetical protein
MQPHPVGGWLFSIGGILMLVCFFLLATLILIAGDR